MSSFINLGASGEHRELRQRFNLRLYMRQQPVMLAMLSLVAIACFLFVTVLSRAYYRQRQELATRWFTRGVGDLNAKNFSAAVTEFRTALLYSRDNYSYQLNLAEALIGSKHTGEASAYLINLWDREPEDGVVNLELARIAAQQGQTQQAIRYYHDAVYAAWPSDQDNRRHEARLELIDLLLSMNAPAQAEPELLAVAENVGDDPVQQERIGELFLQVKDYEHALFSFHFTLKAEPRNQKALAGAGYAAFELGRYPLAERYLEAATEEDRNDTRSAELLKNAQLVTTMDPFRRKIEPAERDRIVVDAFTTAGQRLKSCAVPKSSDTGPAAAQPSLSDDWARLKPRITEEGLRRDPDLVETAMDLVFRIERQTNILCGSPNGKDLALLLIAKMHEGT